MAFFKRLPKFEYIPARTLEEALALLSKEKSKAKVIAGGTDVLVQMKNREITPKYLIGLKGINDLQYINYSETDGLRFGALNSIAAIENSQLIRDTYSILTQATRGMASAQIRNVATVGGNICTALPSADIAPALIVLGAELTLVKDEKKRTVAIEEFFIGPSQTILQGDELLAEIRVPPVVPNSSGVYLKHGLRKAMSLAIASVAVLITEEGNYCRDIRIALGAVAPIPLRAIRAESVLRGKEISENLILETARIASEECHPISDMRASVEYRRDLVNVLTKRAIKQACEKILSSRIVV